MARFYDNEKTGKTHFAAMAGGAGGGYCSEFETFATDELIRDHPREYDRYKYEKQLAARQKRNAAKAEAKPEVPQGVLAGQTVPTQED